MKYFPSKNRRGSAIVIAIIFTFCMFLLLGTMVFRQSTTASHNQISLSEKQATFACRSAIQHFLLKAKLFPTELYDAVEISQGKNPLFNFTEFPSQDHYGNELFEEYVGFSNVYTNKEDQLLPNGKPRYFYLKLPNKESFIRLGSFYNPDYRFLAPDIHETSQDLKYIEPKPLDSSYCADKYLAYYYRDCINFEKDSVNLQPLLETVKSKDIKNLNKYDIAVEPFGSYPYTLCYSINDINVKAIQGMRKYGEEAIEIQVIGSVVNFQNKKSEQVLNRIQKITRKGSHEISDDD